MLSLDQFPGITRQRVLDALHSRSAARELVFRYLHLDETNTVVKELTEVEEGGSVTNDSEEAGAKRTCRFTMKSREEVDFLRDRVQILARLYLPEEVVRGSFPVSPTYNAALDNISNLIARWKLNDISGDLVDSVNAYNLTGSSVTYLQPPLITDAGRSIRVEDTGELRTQDGSFFNSLGEFTIAGWFQADTAGVDGNLISSTFANTWRDFLTLTWDDLTTMTWGDVLGETVTGTWDWLGAWSNEYTWADGDGEPSALGVTLSSDLLNVVAHLVVNGSTLTASTPVNTATNTLTHIAVTWKSGEPLRIYLNGHLSATSPTGENVIGNVSNVKDLVFGGDGYAGLLDDWLIAGEQLNSATIYDIHASGQQAGRTSQERQFVEWSQGVFLTSSATHQTDDNGSATYDIAGYDQGIVLDQTTVEAPYYVASGALYTDALAELLTNTEGLNGFNVVPSTKALPGLLSWPAGTTYLKIANDLCGAIGYDPVFFDEAGVGIVRPHIAPQYRMVEYIYDESTESVNFHPDASRSLDLFDAPNKWVAIVSEPDRPFLRAEYTNSDPADPTSTVSRGRTITKYIDGLKAPDQASLDDQIRWIAQEEAQLYEEVTFSTPIMPIHSHMDMIRFAYPSGLLVEGNFQEVSWSIPLQPGGKMSHTARRAVTLNDYIPPDNPDPDPDPDPDPTKSGSHQSLNNTCTNPLLATNLTGWGALDSGEFTVSRVAITDHVVATFAYQQVSLAGDDPEAGSFLPSFTGLNAADQITIGVDMQCTVEATGNVQVDWYNSANVFQSSEEGPILELNDDGTWKRISLTATAPAGVGTGGKAQVVTRISMVSGAGIWRQTVADYVLGTATVPNPDPTEAPITAGRIFSRTGSRFFMMADAAWAMPVKLTREEVSTYLSTRESQGFNTLIIGAVINFSGGPGPNRYGQSPYVAGNLNNTNNAYYQHIDYIIDAADDLGMVVGIVPVWADGQSGTLLTTTNAQSFGAFLGTRYAAKKNIFWVLGGDKSGATEEVIWRNLATGLDSGGGITTKIQTYMPADNQSSTSWFNTETWIEFHGIQGNQTRDYTGRLAAVTAAYANTGPKPWMDLYPALENNGVLTDVDARRDAYWAVLGGAAGHTYGNTNVANFTATWQAQLTSTAGLDMAHFKNLFTSRPRLEPSNTLVTSGNGSGASYTPAAISSDATCIVVYHGDGATRTVNLAPIAGANAQCWFFNPRTGESTDAGIFAANTTHSFDPSTDEDWVLVIDDTASGREAPGVEIDTDPPPDPTDTTHGPIALANNWAASEIDRDDFNGTGVDTSRWGIYNSPGHGGNGLRRPSQFTIVDDSSATGGRCLRIFGTSNGTTGGMAHRVGQRFGRWSGRMRAEGDSRYHQLLLTWPDNENWPEGGEIDFAEGNCGVDTVHFFLHYFTSNSQSSGSISSFDTAQWNIYEMEWTHTYVKGWCNGTQYFSDTNASHFNNGDFGPHHYAIQLDWFPGGASTTGTGEQRVDWIRVYENADSEPG